MSTQPIVLLNAGGMRSLVATAIAAQHPGAGLVTAVFLDDGRADAAARREFFRQQVEHYQIAERIEFVVPQVRHPKASGMSRGRRLVAAADVALRCDAARLLWPAQVGENFEAVAAATETVLLVQQLVRAETGRVLAIDTPLLEVADVQLVKLGHQMNVPWELSRSCDAPPVPGSNSSGPCNQCLGCQRRRGAFQQAAIDDPVHAEHAR